MSQSVSVGQIVIDCQSPPTLATFYAELLDRPIADSSEFHAVLPPTGDRREPTLMLIQVPEPRTGKNRLHLDFFAADHQAAVERALSLGATRQGDFTEFGATWTTLTDPEGHVFDIGEPH